MLTFKQRYKPRTTREYTKSDLTVYDSAGNTALNALTVYGKSEVVDGVIKSAGDSGSITITSNNNITNLITSIIQGAVSSSGDLLPDNTTRVMTTPIYIQPNTEIFLNSNSTAQVYEVNEWDENDNFLGYSGINSVSGNYTLKATTHKIIVTFRYSNNRDITPEIVANATITLSHVYTTMATFTTGAPLYGVSETVRDVMEWDGTSGEVTKNCASANLRNVTWELINQDGIFATTSITDCYVTQTRDERLENCITSKYPVSQSSEISSNMTDKSCLTANGRIYVRDTSFNNNVTDFVNSLTDVTCIYRIATLTTTPLTQTENESIAGLRTFDGATHFTNNAATDMTVNYIIKVPTIS